mmetsp:Transcript_20267/g.30080  ORF Transcript_20267/g.30080 Transcript_20267/m.30080 type:complete len:205 (+) Transcript_20267:1745-2359(+)
MHFLLGLSLHSNNNNLTCSRHQQQIMVDSQQKLPLWEGLRELLRLVRLRQWQPRIATLTAILTVTLRRQARTVIRHPRLPPRHLHHPQATLTAAAARPLRHPRHPVRAPHHRLHPHLRGRATLPWVEHRPWTRMTDRSYRHSTTQQLRRPTKSMFLHTTGRQRQVPSPCVRVPTRRGPHSDLHFLLLWKVHCPLRPRLQAPLLV